jgi:membrane protein involved in colicin uptake
LRDIGETTEKPPDAYQTWVDHLTELGAETLKNAQDAADSAEAAKESETNAKASEDNAKESENAAAESEKSADADALKAEGFAVGEQNGEPVASGSPYYQNNAKHYAYVAQQGAEESGYAWFDVNDQDGEMYVTITPNLAEDVSFLVNESVGTLEVTYG